jgi:hypothetical protein
MGGRRKWMAVAAVAGLIYAVVSGVLLERRRSRTLVDTGETRASVEASLRKVLPRTVESAQAPGLRSAFEQLQKERYVVSVWLVDRGGTIVLHWRGPGQPGDKVQDLAWGDALPLIEALGPQGLTESQKLQMLAAAAVRREGDHNDVFRHLVRAVPDGTGELGALVVLAYDVSPALGSPPSASYIALLLTSLVGFLVYWLGLPLWVYLDARARGDAAALWGVFVLFTNLVGLIGYLIVISRPGPARV